MTSKTRQFKEMINYSLIIALMVLPGIVWSQLNTNGGFESSEVDTVSGTDVEGWFFQVADGSGDAVFQIVDDTVKQGNKALKITVNSAGSNRWDIQAVAESIAVIQGKTYNYSVWAKANTSGVQVNFTLGNYSYSEYQTNPYTLTTEWKEYTTKFSISDGQTVIRAPIHFSYASNVGDTIYIDNLKIYDPEEMKKPVIVEAESGVLGSYFSIQQDGDITYFTTTVGCTTFTPQDTNRIATYNVTFPDTGYYNLFARLRVGPNTYDDDSFLSGNGFGVKNDTVGTDWVLINGLAAAGYTIPSDIVDELGTAGSQVWKWVNITKGLFPGDSPDKVFFISEDSLTKTFQMSSREDGLWIDKFAFGKSSLRFTVENLDSVQAGSVPSPVEVWEGPPLADSQPKFVGNIYSAAQINNFEAYWNQVTPENAGKWGSVEGTRDVMNWSGLDAAYALAKDNDFPFHFHVLLWGAQQPLFMGDTSSLSAEEKVAEIEEWFDAVAAQYPEIDYLEVVNEPLPGHNPPDGVNGRADYLIALGGEGETGWDWVVNAFQMARDKFPAETKLMINDYGILGSISNTAQYLSLIRLLQSKDLIDIIGVQGHAFTTTAPTVMMKRSLDSLATTGLPIQVTELDIDGPSDDIQLQGYQRIFPALYEHPGVKGITLWGWRPGLWRNDQGAYIINSDGTERPALVWLRDYLDSLMLSIDDYGDLPIEFNLSNNYPNPFNPSTTIEFTLPKSSKVKLCVYNVLGQEVAVLLNQNINVGNHKITFNGSNLSSGLYFYKFVAGEYVNVKKMMLIK